MGVRTVGRPDENRLAGEMTASTKAVRGIKMGKFILRHWIELTAGMVLTVVAALEMKGARGYFAVGGEWLMAPLFVLSGHIFKRLIACGLPWIEETLAAEDDEKPKEEG